MQLRWHLLGRMTLVGLVCWIGVSSYLISGSGARARRDLANNADVLRNLVTADVLRRWISVDSDPRYPDLAGAAARFPYRMCLRYQADGGPASSWGCEPAPPGSGVPGWVSWWLRVAGVTHISESRPITPYGLSVGVLGVVSDDAVLARREWDGIRNLMYLTAVMILALDLLTVWVVGRALHPTGRIIAALDNLDEGRDSLRLPAFRLREFAQIASGVNRLAERLERAAAIRAELTSRLIGAQERERRELAHELHEEFGQCVSALSAVSVSLGQSVAEGERLTERDLRSLGSIVDRISSSLRKLLERTSRGPLEDQALPSALTDLIAEWQAKLRGAPRILYDADGEDPMPDGDAALCIYRVVQECLSNIARHAPGSDLVKIRLTWKDRGVRVDVANDLRGEVAERRPRSSGMGLRLLGERIRALGGSLTVASSGGEFAVSAVVPPGAR